MSLQTLARPGCELHAWLDGPAGRPLVVLVHGAALDHELFQHNVPALAERWRVLNVDVRGHGLSRPLTIPYRIRDVVDDLVAWLDELGVRDAIWIGQSMGGNVAQEMARLHPERVRAMVIVDCACISTALSRFERFMLWIMPALISVYPRETMLRQSGQGASAIPQNQRYVSEATRKLRGDELATVLVETSACMHEAPDYRIPRPFMLVRGSESRSASVAKQWPQWVKREPKCVREVIVAGAGHTANMDQPETFNREVLAFLAELDSASPVA